jgi:hypothetical protein
MEGKVMDPHNQMHHYMEMNAVENRLRRQIPHMRRILIVEKEGCDEEEPEEEATAEEDDGGA